MRALGAELVEHGEDFQAAREEAMRVARTRGLELVPSFHRDLVRGVATYALELFERSSRSRRALCSDRAGLGRLRLHRRARRARPADRDRRRAVDRGARLCALARRRTRRSHQQRRHARRRHGDARARRGGAGRHPRKASRASRWSPTTKSPTRCAPIGPTRTISPKAPAPRRSPRRCRRSTRLAGKKVGLVLSGGNIDFDLFKSWVVAPTAETAMTHVDRDLRMNHDEKTARLSAVALFLADRQGQRREPHALGAGRQRAGRARARRRPVLRALVQHREPDGRRSRARDASVAHHDRHLGHAGGDRAGAPSVRAAGAGPFGDRSDARARARSSANWRW